MRTGTVQQNTIPVIVVAALTAHKSVDPPALLRLQPYNGAHRSGGECLGGMLSSLVFGFAQALGIKFSAVGLDSNLASPIPYAVTIIGLVIFSLVRRSRAKKLHSAAALK